MIEFLICLFGGYLGLHKFYRKQWKIGAVYALTLGGIGIAWAFDTISLGLDLIRKYTSTEKYQARKRAKQEAKARAKAERELAIAQRQERVAQLEKEGVAYCPRCLSTSLQYVERRKRLSVGRAVTGTVLFNPLWGAVGAVTSKKHYGFVKCLKCGYEWKL